MKQHKLGQHYSNNNELLKPYLDYLYLLDNTIVDPFVGQGDLIFGYLNLFEKEEIINKLNNKKIYGYDIDENNIENIKLKIKKEYNINEDILNEIFKVRDSLLDNSLPENSFILTNPPYLAKNMSKKLYKEDFEKYFTTYNYLNDYFEIAINIYNEVSGIWIVPSNILSSEIMKKTRNKIINNLDNIIIYEKSMFDDTDISVVSYINNKNINKKELDIKYISNKELNIKYNIENGLMNDWEIIKSTKNKLKIYQGYIDTKINKGNEKVKLIDVNYKEKELNISKEDLNLLKRNILILRTTDTGTEEGKIGLYSIKELFNSEAEGLITKISSRVYV